MTYPGYYGVIKLLLTVSEDRETQRCDPSAGAGDSGKGDAAGMSEKGCPCLSRSLPPSVRYSSGCEVSPLSSVREEGKDPKDALSPDPGGGGSVRRDSTGFPERGEFLCPAVHGGPLKIRVPRSAGSPRKALVFSVSDHISKKNACSHRQSSPQSIFRSR